MTEREPRPDGKNDLAARLRAPLTLTALTWAWLAGGAVVLVLLLAALD